MRRLFGVVASVLAPAVALAQSTGPEFQITSGATAALSPPAIATDAAGNFVVVWEGAGRDGSDYGVAGRRFGASGSPRDAEFQANAFTSGRQSRASVASDAAGNFIVVWSSAGQDGSGDGIFGRRFDAGGVAAGVDVLINTSTAGNQDRPAVAADPAGNIVVVWESDDASGSGIFGQVFGPGGDKLSQEFGANTTTGGNQSRPAVASDAAGHFVVVWEGDDGGGSGIFGQVFDAGGGRLGAEFRVNTTTAGAQERPAVAADPAGNFVVVWQGAGQGIVGQRYDASGTAMGSELRVDTTTGDQRDPGVAADAAGFQVVWSSPGRGVFGRRYDPGGTAQGDEFQIGGAGDTPRVAPGAGTFIVVWQSGNSVAGRR